MIRPGILAVLAIGLGAAELSITPERVMIDARQAAPAPAEVVLATTGQAKLEVKADIVDPLAAAAAPGKPVFPFTIALSGNQVAPGAPAKLSVAFAPGSGSYASRAWQVTNDVVRVRSSELGAATYDIPVVIRYHARPVIEPAMPLGTAKGQGWELAFTLRSADPDEHIAQVVLDGVRVLGGPGAKPILGNLARADDGACRLEVGAAPAGVLTADLAIVYDRPAAARKLLSLRCRLGEAKDAPAKGAPAPAGAPAVPGPEAPAAPPVRRVRIN